VRNLYIQTYCKIFYSIFRCKLWYWCRYSHLFCIGAGTAIYFAKNGAKLALAGRKEENLKAFASKCEEINPNKEKVEFN